MSITLRNLREYNAAIQKSAAELTDKERDMLLAMTRDDFKTAAALTREVQRRYQEAADTYREIGEILSRYGEPGASFHDVKGVMSLKDRYAITSAFTRRAEADELIAAYEGADR